MLLMTVAFLSACSINGGTSRSQKSESINNMNIFNNQVRYIGRCHEENNTLSLYMSASGFEFDINAESSGTLSVTLKSEITSPYTSQFLNVYIDNVLLNKYEIANETKIITLSISKGTHLIRFNKLNEAAFSSLALSSYKGEGIIFNAYKESKRKRIEFYGDSITCGYGNLATSNSESFKMSTEDAMQTYAVIAAESLNFDYSIVSASGISLDEQLNVLGSDKPLPKIYDTYDLVNKYDMSNNAMDYVVINIGTNDNTALNSIRTDDEQIAKANEFYEIYKDLVRNLKTRYEDVKIICTYNFDINAYLQAAISGAVRDINKEFSNAFVYELELFPNKNGADGHPDVENHKSMAEAISNLIKTI